MPDDHEIHLHIRISLTYLGEGDKKYYLLLPVFKEDNLS